MRMFYIFDIKDDIKYLYKDNPNNLFKILNSIYYMHLEDVNYGFNLDNIENAPSHLNRASGNALFNTLLMNSCDTKEEYITALFNLSPVDIVKALKPALYGNCAE